MVGFPGESEDEFAESIDFVKACQFAGGHVFNYSVRLGTAAEKMPKMACHPKSEKREAP